VKSTGVPKTCSVILDYDQFNASGNRAHLGCIEECDGLLFLPTFMTPGTNENPHQLIRAKRACVERSITHDQYIDQVTGFMRGKKGAVRSINNITVQGSLRMVISPLHPQAIGEVWIPSYIAENTKVLCLDNGIYTESNIVDGDHAIIVRQPCMWSGGIQPVRIRVTCPDYTGDSDWDVNSSMRIPLPMCMPFAGDYDGDEMTLFCVKDEASIKECESFSWDYSMSCPFEQRLSAQVMSRGEQSNFDSSAHQSICTTLCYSDRKRGVIITKCHEKWLTKKSSFIALTNKHCNVVDFMNRAQALICVTASKSSLQSEVGALSRRSKLGAERVTLDTNRIPRVKVHGAPLPHLRGLDCVPTSEQGWFGNPTVRAVSKLCASTMQITLKTKSSNVLEVLSPTLSLLEGSKKWIRITNRGSISVASSILTHGHEDIRCTCSLRDISYAKQPERTRLLEQFLLMVLSECNKRLDNAEMHCLLTLMEFLCSSPIQDDIGIQLETHKKYKELNMIQAFNSCHVSAKYVKFNHSRITPSTTVECMMLGNCHSYPSIHHE